MRNLQFHNAWLRVQYQSFFKLSVILQYIGKDRYVSFSVNHFHYIESLLCIQQNCPNSNCSSVSLVLAHQIREMHLTHSQTCVVVGIIHSLDACLAYLLGYTLMSFLVDRWHCSILEWVIMNIYCMYNPFVRQSYALDGQQ